jgi:hypothetical protein
VIVFLWKAGPAEGVTDDLKRARRHAAEHMRSGQASTAVIEQALFISGVKSLDVGYGKLADVLSWTALCRPSGRITWRRGWVAPELAAS